MRNTIYSIMIRLTATMLSVCIMPSIYSQDISSHEADSLLKSLSTDKSDIDHINTLFRLAQYHMFKPGGYKNDLDSAGTYLQSAAELNKKLKSEDAAGFQLLLESHLAREKGELKDGKLMAERAANTLKNGKNKYYSGKAWFSLSEYYDYNNPNESTEKMRLVELAIQAFQQSGNIEEQAYALKFLADLQDLNNERAKALKTLDRSLQLYESIKFPRLHAVYVLYCKMYYSEGNYKESLNYGLMALKSALRAGDTSMTLCQINNYIGITLIQLKEREKSIIYFKDALKIAEKYDENNTVLLMMHNIVSNYIALKKPGDALLFMKSVPKKFLNPKSEESFLFSPYCYFKIYLDLQKYPEARIYSDEALHIIEIHSPPGRLVFTFYQDLIRFYLDSKQYASAEGYFVKLDSLARTFNEPLKRKTNFFLRFRLDTAQHHYQSAVANLLKYQTLNDSLFNETSNRQIKQLEVEYETEKNKSEIKIKDQDIKMLNQKNELQQSNLKRANLTRNFTIAGIVLLFIIMGLLYRQYRHKQQSNTIITHKNEQLQHLVTEKEWLVKEIHHRVKNNFHIVASLLEIQSSYLKNKEALSAIKESQHRIHSMSIIHQKLYQSETLSTVHMPEYIYELVEYLRDSYAIRESIRFDLQIENIELNHAFAITLGLILNEAITNSIKYAFKDADEGKISISLGHTSDSKMLLSISDNGRGLPADFNSHIGGSMGMDLLQGLADDIGASFNIETNEGTYIRIIFTDKVMSDGSFRS